MEPRLRYTPITPHARQIAALLNDATALGLGAGYGGGKTTILLIGAAQWADVPGYEALIRRANYTDLMMPGGYADVSNEWFTYWGAKRTSIKGAVEWAFPNGGTITLHGGHTLPDHLAERTFQYVGIDEAQEFPDGAVYDASQALLSTPNKSFGPATDGTVLADVPLRLRVAFSPLVTDEPLPPGVVWVHHRFLDRTTRSVPLVPLDYHDNPAIDAEEYERSLSLLLPQTVRDRRLLAR